MKNLTQTFPKISWKTVYYYFINKANISIFLYATQPIAFGPKMNELISPDVVVRTTIILTYL